MSPLTESVNFKLANGQPVPVDLYRSNVSLLLHGDGANNSTTITDSSPTPKTVTAFGDAKISTAQSKFGGSSIAFDGTGDYIAYANSSFFGFGTGDFTWEAFIYATDVSVNRVIFSARLSASGASINYGPTFAIETGNLAFSNGLTWTKGSTSIPLNTFHHVALTRQSGTMNIWLNGVADRASWSEASDFTFSRPAAVGATTTGDGFFNGYIDDLRITKGICRYNANFTPPTAPFPDF